MSGSGLQAAPHLKSVRNSENAEASLEHKQKHFFLTRKQMVSVRCTGAALCRSTGLLQPPYVLNICCHPVYCFMGTATDTLVQYFTLFISSITNFCCWN